MPRKDKMAGRLITAAAAVLFSVGAAAAGVGEWSTWSEKDPFEGNKTTTYAAIENGNFLYFVFCDPSENYNLRVVLDYPWDGNSKTISVRAKNDRTPDLFDVEGYVTGNTENDVMIGVGLKKPEFLNLQSIISEAVGSVYFRLGGSETLSVSARNSTEAMRALSEGCGL